MEANRFIVCIKTENIYIEIAKDVQARFDTSNYEYEKPKGKNEKLIGLIKDEVSLKLMAESVLLRTKSYSYLMDNKLKLKAN